MQVQTIQQKSLLLSIALLGWFALAGQFYVSYISIHIPLTGLITMYFGFFTVTTNILVALCTIMELLRPGTFFSRQTVQTAIAAYITIVFLIYNVILRFLWHPQGLHKIVDELLHLVIPVLYIIYWAIYTNKHRVKWTSVFQWQLYPLAYTIYVMIRGSITGFYPYPFLDVNKSGAQEVLINCLGIAVLFVGFALFFVAIGNFIVKRNSINK